MLHVQINRNPEQGLRKLSQGEWEMVSLFSNDHALRALIQTHQLFLITPNWKNGKEICEILDCLSRGTRIRLECLNCSVVGVGTYTTGANATVEYLLELDEKGKEEVEWQLFQKKS